MDNIGYCVKCKKKVHIEDGRKTQLRNPKTRNMTIDAYWGRCPHCKGNVYHIMGHS